MIMMTKMVQKALDRGRKDFRSVGDMNLFFNTGMVQQHLLAWESSLESQFDLPITSSCAYTRDKFEQLDNSAIVVMQQQHHSRMRW
jgi:DcmR-like sensory protein